MQNKSKKGFAKLHGIENTNTSVVTLSAETIWKENNSVSGVLTKSTFMPFIRSLRAEDYDHTEALIEFLRTKRRLASGLKQRNDRGGNSYYWASFSKPMGSEGAKVMAHPDLLNLVEKYINGEVLIDFTMDELIDQGLS